MHTCPDCYQACSCNGDMDDCIFDTDESYFSCVHFKSEGCDAYWDGVDDDCYDPSSGEFQRASQGGKD